MVRTGIVGLGYFGPNVLRNFAAQENCEMVWACDLSEPALQKVRRQYPSVKTTSRFEDLLEDASVDLILIVTPTRTHADLATRALSAGKHVFIEKPMTSSPEEADALNTLAAAQGKMIFVDHTFVYAPAVRKMAELAEKGDLGKLLYFESSRINLGLIQKDVNALWDLAIHDVSILSTFKDLSAVKTVCCHGSRHFGQQEEDVHLHLTFDDGFAAHIHVSWLSPVKIRTSMLGGTKAMVVYDDTQPSEKIRVYDRGIDHDDTKADPFFPTYRSGDVLIPALQATETLSVEAAHVLECITSGSRPMVSGEEGAKVVRLLALADKSLKNESSVLSL